MLTAPALRGTLSLEADVASLVLDGCITVETREVLQDLLRQVLARPAQQLQIDLTAVRSCDAQGVVALGVAADTAASQSRRLSLRTATAELVQTFELAGLGPLFADSLRHPQTALIEGLQLSSDFKSRDRLDSALTSVVVLAHAIIQTADGISVTMPRSGTFVTVAASNDVVLEMDHDQYDTGQGPCLDAAKQGRSFQVHAIDDEVRWPAFIPRARERGIRSVLSTPLLYADRPVGALNMYSRSSASFGVPQQRWATLFADHASALSVQSRGMSRSASLSRHITAALESREAVALAQGMLMQRDGLSAEQAHRQLRELSRASRRPLHDVCVDLLGAHATVTATASAAEHAGGSQHGSTGC